MSGLTYIFVIAGWKCLFWNFRSLNVFFWTPPGPEVTPASSDSTSAGQRKPCSREEYFPGDVSHHQRALHTLIVWWRNQPHSVSTGLFSLQMILSSGISLWMGLRSWMSLQEVNHPQDWGPARLGITRCRRAVRPLREPQADLHRRLHRTVEDKVTDSSDLRIRTSIRRDQVRFHKSSCLFAGRSLWSSVSFFFNLTGEAFSPYRQGQYMKKRRLDTWDLVLLFHSFNTLSNPVVWFLLLFIYFNVNSHLVHFAMNCCYFLYLEKCYFFCKRRNKIIQRVLSAEVFLFICVYSVLNSWLIKWN